MDTISTMIFSWWLVSIAALAGLMLVGLITTPFWRREMKAVTEKAENLKKQGFRGIVLGAPPLKSGGPSADRPSGCAGI